MTETFSYDDAGSLQIDRCPRCHGLWLDRGELQAIYDQIGEKRAAADTATPNDSLGIMVLSMVLLVLAILVILLVVFLTQSR